MSGSGIQVAQALGWAAIIICYLVLGLAFLGWALDLMKEREHGPDEGIAAFIFTLLHISVFFGLLLLAFLPLVPVMVWWRRKKEGGRSPEG